MCRTVPLLRNHFSHEDAKTQSFFTIHQLPVLGHGLYILDTCPPSRIRGRQSCAEPFWCSALALRKEFRSPVRHGRHYNIPHFGHPSAFPHSRETVMCRTVPAQHPRSARGIPRIWRTIERNVFFNFYSPHSGHIPDSCICVHQLINSETLETR